MNWIQNQKVQVLSIPDKMKALIKIGHKLVLCQLHELERLQVENNVSHRGEKAGYVEFLYTHYIVKQLPKTYLCNDMLIVQKPIIT